VLAEKRQKKDKDIGGRVVGTDFTGS